jgi:hypothetical protein
MSELPNVIYLIPEGDGHTYLWCDDPDPTGYGDASEAVKYTRAIDKQQIIDAIESCRNEILGNDDYTIGYEQCSEDAIAAVEKLFEGSDKLNKLGKYDENIY